MFEHKRAANCVSPIGLNLISLVNMLDSDVFANRGSHMSAHVLQPCKYQLSKSVVHEIKFGDIINILPYCDRYLKLIGSVRCFKGAKLMEMMLDKCIFQKGFPYFK